MAESPAQVNVNLIRMDDGRWRVIIDDADTGASYQFPWDALQCALNGSLDGRPLSDLQTMTIHATSLADPQAVARIRAAEVEHRALVAALRGIDGEGI